MSDRKESIPPMNPYGGVGGGGITLPPYYKPTEGMGSGSTYYPTSEELGEDEMRITFVGTCPFPPHRNQAATCIMVELLGNGELLLRLRSGCLRNVLAMQVPLQVVNDIFLTHLDVDDYGELPYLFAFAPWAARWKPLRVHGPSGQDARGRHQGHDRRHEGDDSLADDGFGSWHRSVTVTRLTSMSYFRDDDGICDDQDGVMAATGAVRTPWTGPWPIGSTGTASSSSGPATAVPMISRGAREGGRRLRDRGAGTVRTFSNLKIGLPAKRSTNQPSTPSTRSITRSATDKAGEFAAGMVTHIAYDDDLVPEHLPAVRVHWDGLFALGRRTASSST